jgi:hypothetical protein
MPAIAYPELEAIRNKRPTPDQATRPPRASRRHDSWPAIVRGLLLNLRASEVANLAMSDPARVRKGLMNEALHCGDEGDRSTFQTSSTPD